MENRRNILTTANYFNGCDEQRISDYLCQLGKNTNEQNVKYISRAYGHVHAGSSYPVGATHAREVYFARQIIITNFSGIVGQLEINFYGQLVKLNIPKGTTLVLNNIIFNKIINATDSPLLIESDYYLID